MDWSSFIFRFTAPDSGYMFPNMNQSPKQVTDWAAYIEDVRREAREQGWAQGRAEGLEEGYQKAVTEASVAMEAIVGGVAELIKRKVAEITHHQEGDEEQSQPRVRYRPRLADVETIVWTGEETNREKVLRALKYQPGMRPVEIIAWLEKHAGQPNANSILTTIKRMRGTDIEKRGDGWFIRGQVESAA